MTVVLQFRDHPQGEPREEFHYSEALSAEQEARLRAYLRERWGYDGALVTLTGEEREVAIRGMQLLEYILRAGDAAEPDPT